MKAKALFLLIGGGLLFLSTLYYLDMFEVSSRSQAQATGHPNPIFNEEDALSVSQDRFAQTSTASVVRLISVESLSQWSEVDYQQAGWDLSAPVWLVGLRASNITVDDVLPPPPFLATLPPVSGSTPTPPGAEPVDGAFYAWDANGGIIITEGALFPHNPSALDYQPTFDSIEDLSNETLSIAPATEIP